MDKLFDEFRRGFADIFWPRLLPMAPALPEVREPFYDLVDEGKAYRIRVEAPGIPKDKIEIHATEDNIEVNAEAAVVEEEKKGGKAISRERSYSKLYRCVTLPEAILPDKTEATLKDGILEIEVPKKTPTPEPKRHRIKVK
jgi:HSP20 family protein